MNTDRLVGRRISAWLTIAILGALAQFGSAFSSVSADEPQPEATKSEAADAYAVPEGGTDELVQFIEDLQSKRPRTRDELVKVKSAIVTAAETLLGIEDLAEENAVRAVQTKFDALKLLGRFGDETAGQKLEEFKQSLADDPRAAIQAELVLLGFVERQESAQSSPSEYTALLADVTQHLAANPLNGRSFAVFYPIVRDAEYDAQADEAAAAYRALASAAGKCDDEQVAERAAKLEGAARRLELPGKPLELIGTTIEGDPLDWQAYRGKVVLVDFWATWCGPCVRELPNVQEQYKLYHDQGFDVVGISLDDDRARLVEFLKERDIPWTTLHEATAQGWDHPMSVYYGIMGIPTVILVDQAGKVVSLRARGEALGTLLRQLLGPPRSEPVEAIKPGAEVAAG